jgi:hypothetical protein
MSADTEDVDSEAQSSLRGCAVKLHDRRLRHVEPTRSHQYRSCVWSAVAAREIDYKLTAAHRDDLCRVHANGSRSARRQIEHSTLYEGAAVVHADVYRLAIAWIAHGKTCTKRQTLVSNGSSIGIEPFARGCFVPSKLIAIPRG